MTVQELEVAVRELPAVERREFVAWVQEFLADQWDAQIEVDVLDGRFDAIGKEIDASSEHECQEDHAEVQKIESAIRQLSGQPLTKLSEWFEDYLAQEVDRKLEDAIDRGFFDEMARQAEAERQAGRCTPL